METIFSYAVVFSYLNVPRAVSIIWVFAGVSRTFDCSFLHMQVGPIVSACVVEYGIVIVFASCNQVIGIIKQLTLKLLLNLLVIIVYKTYKAKILLSVELLYLQSSVESSQS